MKCPNKFFSHFYCWLLMKKLMHKNDQFFKEAGRLKLNTIRCCPPSPAHYQHSLCIKKTRGSYQLYERCDTILKIDNFRRHATLIIAPTVVNFNVADHITILSQNKWTSYEEAKLCPDYLGLHALQVGRFLFKQFCHGRSVQKTAQIHPLLLNQGLAGMVGVWRRGWKRK